MFRISMSRISLPKNQLTSLILSFITGVLLTYAAYVYVSHADEQAPKIPYQDLRLFAKVMERVRTHYVNEVSDNELIQNAIKGMLAGLDPHSGYLNIQDSQDLAIQTRGEFGGLGIQVTMEEGLVKVISPIDDTPAAKAGIQAQDIIIKLDNKPVMGMTLEEAIDIMRGKPGTSLVLTIVRTGTEPFDVKVVRDRIEIQSSRSVDLGEGYLYLRVSTFSEKTKKQMDQEIEKALASKDGIKGVVLDLRNNPGGLLESAIEVADTFLQKGLIVYSDGRIPSSKFRAFAEPNDLIKNAPMVVLVNGGSASASEIVAGALQDNKRAIIMGTKTFGKGSVQTIYPLTENTAIKLTTALYYTPSGRSIQAKGIEPDIMTERATIQHIETAKAVSEADLKSSIANPNNKQANKQDSTKPNTSESISTTPDKKPASKKGKEDVKTILEQDYQLNEALNLLRGLNIYALQKKKAPVKTN